ncbi:hypothetical protein TUMSATVNIG1_24800 [Vibrio nigripulchritudo]|nr:hypothetical protein TUMSATVNIG1_24800 [Vibrio nigripulchritudo]
MTIQEGTWTLVDHDPMTGRMVWRTEQDGMTHFRTDYPVDAVIDDNERAFNESLHQRFGDGQRIASIPLNVYFDQLHEAHLQGDKQYLSQWLNDPNNRAFRTFKGKV